MEDIIMAKGSVITTHLLDGDPQGVRRVFIKNKTCEMYVIPRTQLDFAKNNTAINLKQPALYILLENLNSYEGKPKVYIGHAEDVGNRLLQDITEEINGVYVLKKDTPFPTPSRAAWIASGTGLNGWNHWKNKDGKSLDEVYRKEKK